MAGRIERRPPLGLFMRSVEDRSMTRRRLKWTLLLSVAGYAIVIGIAGYVVYADPTPNRRLADAVKAVLTPSLAIPAAIFGWIFQRRLAYVASLRALFEHLSVAVRQAVQLTKSSSPPTDEYGPVLAKLSLVIDEVRTVFPNRRERPLLLRRGELDSRSRHPVDRRGTAYPLEPVKDLFTLIELLQKETWSTERAAAYRDEILKRWRIMQEVLFLEFDRAPPPA